MKTEHDIWKSTRLTSSNFLFKLFIIHLSPVLGFPFLFVILTRHFNTILQILSLGSLIFSLLPLVPVPVPQFDLITLPDPEHSKTIHYTIKAMQSGFHEF